MPLSLYKRAIRSSSRSNPVGTADVESHRQVTIADRLCWCSIRATCFQPIQNQNLNKTLSMTIEQNAHDVKFLRLRAIAVAAPISTLYSSSFNESSESSQCSLRVPVSLDAISFQIVIHLLSPLVFLFLVDLICLV